jgi:uncharacterized protein (DUF983 family)
MKSRQANNSLISILGAGILALGFVLLMANLDVLSSHLNKHIGPSADDLGIVASIGLAGLHALHTYAVDEAGFLSSLWQLLVSFWPLLLIMTGAILLRPLAGAHVSRNASRNGMRSEVVSNA